QRPDTRGRMGHLERELVEAHARIMHRAAGSEKPGTIAGVLLDELQVAPDDLEARTGWSVKPEGACKAEVCVPLPPEVRTADGRLDVNVLSERLGMPLVADDEHGLWALGPETAVTGRALSSAVAPALTLPDVDGNPFDLASLRGQKVLLVAWASW